ncbi:MAG: HAD family hydrolase [Armatimonadetes bacterium]|nr:HAD family hydrolase [Armatimonadota bacterium]
MINAAVFDVDGTVATCPYDFDAMRAAVAKIAARWQVDTGTLDIRGVIEQIDHISERLGAEGEAFRREAEAAVTAIEVAAAEGATIFPGAAEALLTLRSRGVDIALITRNSRAAADRVLSGLDSYDMLLTRNDVPFAKPNPDHVLRALAALGGTPETTVVIGDHDFDMRAGRAACVHLCVGVRTGTSTDERLLTTGADVILDSIVDLPSWLATQGELPL